MRIRKAIIPAAGLGTRFLPATKTQPKEMLPVIDRPVIQYVIEEAAASGVTHVYVVTGQGKSSIEDYFDRSPQIESLLQKKGRRDLLGLVRGPADICTICFLRQREPLGLGHAIKCARPHIGVEPFAVLLPDVIVVSEKPCLAQIQAVFNLCRRPVIAVHDAPEQDLAKYGVVAPGEYVGPLAVRVKNMIEKPPPGKAPSNLVITGRYVLTAEIFDALEETPPGANGEIQLTDALRKVASSSAVYACRFVGTPYDAGDPLNLLKTSVHLGLAREDMRRPLEDFIKERYWTICARASLPESPGS